MLNILICDDEQAWTDKLAKCLESILQIPYNINSFSDPNKLFDYLQQNNADIIFMDIQMPGITGIEAAKHIYDYNKHIQLVFTSVSRDYIQDVFSVRPVYYLLKPFEIENVKEAFDLAMDNLEKHKHSIKIVSKGKTINILADKIEYVESDKRTVNLYHDNEVTQSLMKLDDVESMLTNDFVRCHQSYLVNINFIARISNNEIELHSGTIIPVAKSRFKQAKKTIVDYWENQI